MRGVLWLFFFFAARLAAETAFRATLTDRQGKPVADAVVSLTALDHPVAVTAGPETKIVQRGQEFIPRVTAIAKGTPVSFPNNDTVQHHVYSLSKPKKFEFPLYNPGQAETIVFDQPGLVTLGCNIHDWMLAYLVVLDTPYFRVTGADGRTAFAAPPGTYRLEVWHPQLSKPFVQTLRVVENDSEVALSLALRPDRRIRRGADSAGKNYE